MKLSIIGYGQMGQLIHEIATQRGHEVVSVIDPFHPTATHTSFCDAAMEGVETCICFTQPDVAMQNIDDALRWKKQLIMGTTGWEKSKESVRQQVADAGIGMVYSSNFSIGVNIFFKLLENAGKVFNGFEIYDVLAHEAHHKLKRDSPSGTAITMANILLETIDRKKSLYTGRLDRKIEPEELHFSSMRGGSIPGTHSVYFDSDFDTIELTHTARNRRGFATGAVIAAEWLAQQKGMFTEREMMNQLLGT